MPEGDVPDDPVTVPYPPRRRDPPDGMDPTWRPEEDPDLPPEGPVLDDDPRPPWAPKPPGRPDPIGG